MIIINYIKFAEEMVLKLLTTQFQLFMKHNFPILIFLYFILLTILSNNSCMKFFLE